MSVVYDSSSVGADATVTWNHTCSSGLNRVLIVTVFSSSGSCASAYYNSIQMSDRLGYINDPTYGIYLTTFILINPSSGTNGIIISSPGGSFRGIAASYNGATQVLSDYTRYGGWSYSNPWTKYVYLGGAYKAAVAFGISMYAGSTSSLTSDIGNNRQSVPMGASNFGLYLGDTYSPPSNINYTASGTGLFAAIVSVEVFIKEWYPNPFFFEFFY